MSNGLSKANRFKEVAEKIDAEGLDYYLLHYGPDVDTLAAGGISRDDLAVTVRTLRSIEDFVEVHLDTEEET